MSSTSFSTEYAISLIVALGSTYSIAQASPTLNPTITYVVIPLSVAYVTLQVLNYIMPGLNASGARVTTYVENKTLGQINRTGYIQIFPPLLAITILTFILLFSQNLSG